MLSGAMYSQKNGVSSSQQQPSASSQSIVTSTMPQSSKSSFHMISPGLAQYHQQQAHNKIANDSSVQSKTNQMNSSGNVKFSGHCKEKIDEREKYLTAKYPNHQMLLIKKRLKVEFWIDEQLKYLFEIKDDNTKEDHDICPDDLVDSLLDMDSDDERRFHLLKQLKNAKMPKENVTIFVDELLIKLRML